MNFIKHKVKRTTSIIAACCCIILLLSQCGKDNNIPDVSNIDIDMNIIRFEKEMYETDSSQYQQKAKELLTKYNAFAKRYTEIMRDRPRRDSSDEYILEYLMKGPQMHMLYDTCMALYDDFSSYENEIKEVLKYYQFHFPKMPIPQIYTCLTEFTYQGFTDGPNMLVLSTEYFLGENFSAYQAFAPQYHYRYFREDYWARTVAELLATEMMAIIPQNNMLDAMIDNGKKIYITEQLIPYAQDSMLHLYSKEQMQWCEDNEELIWSHFVNEDLLYSVKRRDFVKFISPAPHSPGMPPDAPGRTANYIGWKIIKKYMEKNPQISLEDLANEVDAQKILKDSKYKGR